jgi:methanethiol S-methyltransferase
MKNFFPRLLLLILIVVPFFYWQPFWDHFSVYLTGTVVVNLITSQWHVVVISIVLFLLFLIPLSYRRRANWMEYGLVSAFFVSLFVEMYGLPFTLLFASHYFLPSNVILPPNVVSFYLFGVGFGMDLAMFYGAIIMTIGGLLIIGGWIQLYLAVRHQRNTVKQQFVTAGLYNFSRHPQYLGFILVILGWFVGWPSPLTVIFTPIILYKYFTVGRAEEKEIVQLHPEYANYQSQTPFLI